ncbi:PREDICTED: lachesin-like [Nicrophorus vespilloides]|uniref:Lachesin-like n=1 Tax=Nicrophorus vespilloides TaxID=110193 RepID=A0ABM1NB08_NICVS|nr:PREDICTED: lachesin-like [Nicrophorus vespilloides]
MDLHSPAKGRSWKCLIVFVLLVFPTSTFVLGHTTNDGDGIGRVRRSYETKHRGKDVNVKRGPGGGKLGGGGRDGAGVSVFATENCTVVMAQLGGTAILPCVVRKFNTGVVSWIRKRDYHLLTVGLTTYNTDDRFMVEHVRHLQNWGLLIKHVQFSDAGIYECQVSIHPATSIIVELKVTEASAEVLGAPDLHVRSGSSLRLVCTMRQSTEPPSYVFWYHEQRMINYDPGVHVIADRSSSILLLPDADKSHNGNYTCCPSNAIPASINVHVLNATAEEKPAAMQHANTGSKSMYCSSPRGNAFMVLLLLALFLT